LKKRPVPELYKKLIQEDEKGEVCEPSQKSRQIMNFVKDQKWADVNTGLLKAFNSGNAHWAMKIYYENESNKELIIPTMLFDTLNALNSIKAPDSSKEYFLDIIDKFTLNSIAATLESIDDLLELESD
jgi:hypothetical protein